MRVGQARKRDANEKAIVDALRHVGALVIPISGEGAPDLLVRYRGRVEGLEVKSTKGTRTKVQVETMWPIVRDVPSALAALGVKV